MGKDIIIEEEGKGGIVLYQTPDGQTNLEVKLENESVWLTQSQMTILFETTKQNVSLHINNLFKEGELAREVVVKDLLTTKVWRKRPVRQREGPVLQKFHRSDIPDLGRTNAYISSFLISVWSLPCGH